MADWYSARDPVAAFLRAVPLAPGTHWRMRPTHANGQIAFGHYEFNEPQQTFVAHGICVLTLEGALIANITNFSDLHLVGHFALPATIEPGARVAGPDCVVRRKFVCSAAFSGLCLSRPCRVTAGLPNPERLRLRRVVSARVGRGHAQLSRELLRPAYQAL